MFNVSHRKLAIALLGLIATHAFPAAAQTDPYVGEIRCAAFNFAPRGWALANGQTLLIQQNEVLFSLLGTTYGGDGRTTFKLPDLQGRTMIHWGQGQNLSPRSLGESIGSEVNQLSVANLPAHTHAFAPLASANDATSISPADKVPAAKARTTLYTDPTNVVAEHASQTSATGNSLPVNNMQPSLAVNCFIALVGIYPARD